MSQSLPDGLYDQLLTEDLAAELTRNLQDEHYTLKDLDSASATRRLADALAEQLAKVLEDISAGDAGDSDNDSKTARLQAQLEFANATLVEVRKRLSEQYADQDCEGNI